jgi:hypothetical protein
VVTDANGTVLSFSSNGFTMPASDVTVTPRFTIQKFTITYRDDGDTLAVDTFAYGANITPIADPTKEGYTFIGWSIELPSTMPANNLLVGALWQKNSYKVTVTQVTGGTISIYYYDETGHENNITTGDSIYYGAWIYFRRVVTDNGYNFNSYVVTNADGSPIATPNNSHFVMPANDVTVTAIFDVKSYELTINYLYQNGAEAAPSYTDTIEYNTAYSVVSPALTGYTASQDTVMGTMGAENMIVRVIYSINSYNITVNQVTGGTVSVSVEDAPASTTSNTTANYNTRVQLSQMPDNGYSFNGFTVTTADGTPIAVQNNAFTMPANDVTVSANFTANEYTITYYMMNGSSTILEVDTFLYGDIITPIANPTREGYTFTGWSEAIPTTMPAHSIAVSAQWQVNSYNITINQVAGGTITVTENNIGANSTTVNTTAAFGSLIQLSVSTNNGYTFNDFVVTNADGTPIAITNNSYFMMPANDVTVTANFTANEYTITYLKDYEVLAVDTFACGDTIIPIADPTVVGFTFIGWQPALPTTMPAYNMEAHAQWQINSYRINIAQVQGGSVQATNVIDSAEYASWVQLSAVANDGYTFYGIVVTDTGGTVLSTINNGFAMPASDVTVTATFTINSYDLTIHYLYLDGTQAAPAHTETIEYNTAYSVVSPVVTGYTASQDTVMGIMGAADVIERVIYRVNSYNITYINDLDTFEVVTYDYGDTIDAMSGPEKEDYIFTGWNPAEPFTMPDSNMTLYAQWELIPCMAAENLAVGSITATSALITWNSSQNNSFGGVLYENGVLTESESQLSQSWHLSELQPSTHYRVGVFAYCSFDRISDTVWLNFNTNDTCYPPVSVSISDVTAHSALLSYDFGTHVPSDFMVNISTDLNFDDYIPVATSTAPNYFPTSLPLSSLIGLDLHSGTTYYVRMASQCNPMLTSIWSETLSFTTLEEYTVTIDTNITNGTVTADATVAAAGTIVNLTATPDNGYSFGEWVVTTVNTPAPEIVTVTDNSFVMPEGGVNVSATFTPNSYKVTINQATGGVVMIILEGAAVGTTIGDSVQYNSWVRLDALTFNGYTFGDFVVTTVSGDTLETPNSGFMMPAEDVTVTATFSVNNYTITYMDGNSILTQDTFAFGANITPIANPTREGYTFTGWNPALPTTMPAEDLIVNAQWQVNSYNITINQVTGGTITVSFAGESATSYISTTTDTSANFETWIQLSETTDDGYTFGDFVVTTASGDTIETPNNGFIMPAENVTVTAVYTVNNYTITYMDGNSILAQDTFAFGATITPIANPTKEGYTFTGWNPALPTTMPANDVTVNAQWQINSYDITVNQVTGGTITVTVTGATAGTTTNTTADYNTWVQLSEVTLDGYTFGNFVVTTADGTPIETPNNGFMMPASDVTITATYTVNNYTITYMNGNSILAQDTFAFGATITPIANPTKEGYTFTGWDPALPTTMPANDVTVNAQWQINSYDITVNQVTGGTITVTVAGTTAGITTNTTVDYNTWVQLSEVTEDGYTFVDYLVTDEDGEIIETPNNGFMMPASDVTVTATYTVNNYTITYMDGNSILAQDTVAFGATITPIANPTKEGYTFTGWNPALPTTMPANDLIVNAQWQINSYDITINQVTGGTITVSFAGETVTSYVSTTTDTSAIFETWIQLSETTDDGYTFGNFVVTTADGTPIETPNNGFMMPASDVTVTATYTVNNYTITYMDGNSILAQDTFAFGATITPIANPTKEGYTFTGWDPALPTTMPANDVTVNAQWQINSYDITVNQVTGGTITVTVTGATAGITTNTTADYNTWVQLSEVTLDGYTFGNFVVTTADGTPIETPNNGFMMPASDVTVTATYTVNNYTITYMDGNSILAQDTFAFGATITPIANPTKEGYTFTGWSPALPTTMPANDLTVDAQWQINSYDITVNQMTGGTITVTVTGATAGTTTNTTADYNTWIQLSAAADYGYDFVDFVVTTVSGDTIETPNNGFIMPAENVTVTAIFTLHNFNITVNVSDQTPWGTVSGSGSFAYGSTDTLTATADEGYIFLGWNDLSIDNPRIITVDRDSNFIAFFIPEEIEIISNDTLMGYVNVQLPGGGHLSPNTPIVITAIPEPHYHFVSWSDGNTDNPRTIFPAQAIGLTAIFAIDQHTITVLSNDGTMGEVAGDGTFDYGSEIQISATAFTNYVFVSWNDGNTDNPRTITVEQDSIFTAIFQIVIGINDANLSNVNVYSYDNQVVVANAEGFSVEIYDMSGRLIVSESNISQSVRKYIITTDGIYLVKVGNNVFKKVKIAR